MNGIKSAESGATALSTDKNVLYIMLIIAVVNVLGYLMMGNFEAVVFFVIVAYLSTFFTKNMVIVFLISILATNFLMATNFRNKKEGMQNNDTKEISPTTPTKATPTPTPTTKATPIPTTTSDPKPTNQASKKTSGEKKKEGMNGKLAPAKFNDDADDDEGDATPFPNTPAQQAKNVERAHDNLQNMGGMGVSAAQTEQVMQQQKILMDNMKTMQPFLETAERFLDKFNMKGIDGLLGKIGINGSSPTTAATAATAAASN
jgi:hypothetical protein